MDLRQANRIVYIYDCCRLAALLIIIILIGLALAGIL